MPNQNKTPQPGKTGEGRRRRRRPRGGSGAKSSQGAAQNTAQQAVKPAAQNAAAHPAQNATQSRSRRGRNQGAAAAKSTLPARTAPAAAVPGNGRRAGTPAPKPAESPRRARSRRPVEEDPGLPLIARRPPKQKFANFEEYLAAHGGVTAPVEGAEEAPAPPEGEA